MATILFLSKGNCGTLVTGFDLEFSTAIIFQTLIPIETCLSVTLRNSFKQSWKLVMRGVNFHDFYAFLLSHYYIKWNRVFMKPFEIIYHFGKTKQIRYLFGSSIESRLLFYYKIVWLEIYEY